MRAAAVLCHSEEVADWESGGGQVAPYKGGAGTARPRPEGVAASVDHRAVPGVRGVTCHARYGSPFYSRATGAADDVDRHVIMI